MKKYFKLRYLFSTVIGIFVLVGLFYQIFVPAKITHDPLCIIYEGEMYVETTVHDGWNVRERYSLVRDYSCDDKRIYYKGDLLCFTYFEPYSEELDENMNFIRLPSWDVVLMKDDFVFPTIYNNIVSEVWMLCSVEDEKRIKNEDIVNHILDCAKSNGEKELDKEVYDYIVENSWDNHCIYLKYEGYPLVEEFFVTQTKDGRYIVDQYTTEEYDTIYYDEH